MDARFVSVDAQDTSPTDGFRARNLRQLVSLAWPYRRTLLFGLVCTVLFASLHTMGVGTAFPVFKILLEEEGLAVWADRTVVGNRLGVEFDPLKGHGDTRLVLQRVHQDSALYQAGLRPRDIIRDVQGRPAAELLHDLAEASSGATVAVTVASFADHTPSRVRPLSLHPHDATRSIVLLRWAVSLIPAKTARDKLATLECILAVLVVLVVVSSVFRYIGEVLIARAILRSMMDLRAQLYERTLHLPMSFFAGRPTSDLVTRFVQDIQEIQRGLITLFGKFIREPLRAAFILVLAFTLDWRITLTMLVVAPASVLVFLAIGRSVKKANKKLLQAYGMMIGALTASLQNLRVVKAYTAEEQERARLAAVDWRMYRQQLKLARLQAFVSPMIEVLAVVAGSFATVWLAGRVLHHELSMSKFVSLGVVLSILFDPLRKLTDVYVRVKRSTAGADRIFQVLNQPVESDLSASDAELKPLQHAMEYVNVSFTYPGAERPALRGIHLTIQRGETVAFVGPNGCGKTTLVSLLPRLFDPDEGEIRYDGVDIRRVSLESLRRQIGLVSQEAVVFAGTPVENIAYGSASASVDRSLTEDAALRASADEFIRQIPGGYEANLGERGTTLSGGQRQRLAIARAIFRDAPILIFDEATSQVDSESELAIQTALKEFSKGRTTIIVAHRLSTIQFASRIVVLDAGRVIDTGKHKELFDRCPLYRNLCETQWGADLKV